MKSSHFSHKIFTTGGDSEITMAAEEHCPTLTQYLGAK